MQKIKKFSALIVAIVVLSLIPSNALGNIDLQADINQIAQGLNKFDANSSNVSSVTNISEVRKIFSNNSAILNEIGVSVSRYKKNLISVKRMIPTRDTKETPKYDTLMNIAKGYEDWLKYQKINQRAAEQCLRSSGKTYNSFLGCSLNNLQETSRNERLSKVKLQSAWNAWKQWQIKFGHA